MKEEQKPTIEEFRKSLLIRFDYYDPGNHWCKYCNHVSGNVYEVFEHLHSKRHNAVSVCVQLDRFSHYWGRGMVLGSWWKPYRCLRF